MKSWIILLARSTRSVGTLQLRALPMR
jgi:hypothetical protein